MAERRRVTRMIGIEGDPIWVAATLASSLPAGVTVIATRPNGLNDQITVTEGGDAIEPVRRLDDPRRESARLTGPQDG